MDSLEAKALNLMNVDLQASTSLARVPDLLSPAGNWACAKAAVENGADAIYFGLDRFNARMRSENFTEADLPALMSFLHQRGVKGYVTLNTLIFQNELQSAEQYIRSIVAAGVDAAIVQDVGICNLIRHVSPDFPIHGSTQMTVTSAAGVEFAAELGCQLVVLARECSIEEINKIQSKIKTSCEMPLEVFVHGALCVAYSGQCLTSESLGGRSANRGECAQACRMPYDLICDGEKVDLGDRQYLLSPQDLSGLEVLPELIKSGVTCLKIEGRLKAPEYVANVTRVYRQAIDRIAKDLTQTPKNYQVSSGDRYDLEMAFSRGLYTGWFKGINNQELAHARFGKKRGVYLGTVSVVEADRFNNVRVVVRTQAPVKPGDGVVFDAGRPDQREEGGRVYTVDLRRGETFLTFGRDALNLAKIQVGDRIWKTSDPELEKRVRQSYDADNQYQRPLDLEVHGAIGEPLVAIARDGAGHVVQAESQMPCIEAHSKPLDGDRLRDQLGRLGNTPFVLGELKVNITDQIMVPVSELNRIRRELVEQLAVVRSEPKRWQLNEAATFSDLLPLLPETRRPPAPNSGGSEGSGDSSVPNLIVLVRELDQVQAAVKLGVKTIYCEFEDPREYGEAVQFARQAAHAPQIYVAPPRIMKSGENWIMEQVTKCKADGYLVRNYDHLKYFGDEENLKALGNPKLIGDFSLNVANALTAKYFKTIAKLDRLTASYDLNIQQLEDLLESAPPEWFEITLHQHMPMFHMEHCVFCAFLSEGTDYTNCGRPCDRHSVTLRDRTGTEHILKADAGCRNTLFNGVVQTGGEHAKRLIDRGVRNFRIEFVNETPHELHQIMRCYQQLLNGDITGGDLWRSLQAQNAQKPMQRQLGVTRGTIDR
jgi:U32 family peptidase